MRWMVGLIALVLLSGCKQGIDDRPVLRVSNWGGAGEDGPFDRMVQAKEREFEKANGARVRKEGIPDGYVPKMILNFIAGTQPDVMVVDASSAGLFINNGMLQDLRPFIEKDADFKLSDYYENVLDTYRRPGKPGDATAPIYAIPNDFTPMVVYYNKDLFDEAGVPYPKDDWTFEDFRQTALKLTKKGQYGFFFGNWMPGWIMFLWNNGADVLSLKDRKASGVFDSPKSVETYKFLQDLVLKDKVSPTLSEAAALGVDPFANGQAAMAVSGHWSLVDYRNAPMKNGKKAINWERLGVVNMPHNVPTSQTAIYMSAYGIPKGAKNADLAWKYIKMWTSRAVQTEYQSTGIAVCARKDVSLMRAGREGDDSMDTPKVRAEHSQEAEFLPIIATGRPPYGSKVEGYEIVEKVGQSAMQSIMNGADVQRTLSDAARRIDREFAKSK